MNAAGSVDDDQVWRDDARRVLAIAGATLRRLARDRSNIFFILIFPILLVLVVGIAFGGDDDLSLGVVAPADDPLADRVVSALRADGSLDLHDYASESTLRSAVEHGRVEGGVVVPSGFAEHLRAGDSVSIGFLAGPSGVGAALQPVVDAAVRSTSKPPASRPTRATATSMPRWRGRPRSSRRCPR